jgi:hypothetical protein
MKALSIRLQALVANWRQHAEAIRWPENDIYELDPHAALAMSDATHVCATQLEALLRATPASPPAAPAAPAPIRMAACPKACLERPLCYHAAEHEHNQWCSIPPSGPLDCGHVCQPIPAPAAIYEVRDATNSPVFRVMGLFSSLPEALAALDHAATPYDLPHRWIYDRGFCRVEVRERRLGWQEDGALVHVREWEWVMDEETGRHIWRRLPDPPPAPPAGETTEVPR